MIRFVQQPFQRRCIVLLKEYGTYAANAGTRHGSFSKQQQRRLRSSPINIWRQQTRVAEYGYERRQPFSNKTEVPNDDKDHTRPGNNITTAEKESVSKKSISFQTKSFAQDIKAIPNLITLFRIACTPALGYLIVENQMEYALIGCAAAGFSDWLDGYVAKTYNQKTVLGTFLDPIADKLTITVLSVSLCYKELLPFELVVLWFVRDTLLIGFTASYLLRNNNKDSIVQTEPTGISKVNTALQFLTIASAMTQSIFIYQYSDIILTTLCWTTAGTTIASGYSYLGYTAFSYKK